MAIFVTEPRDGHPMTRAEVLQYLDELEARCDRIGKSMSALAKGSFRLVD